MACDLRWRRRAAEGNRTLTVSLEVVDSSGWYVRNAWSVAVVTARSCPLVTVRGTG